MIENRIISYDNESNKVSWWYDDHKTNQRITVSESERDLLGKMFIHIPEMRKLLPPGIYEEE